MMWASVSLHWAMLVAQYYDIRLSDLGPLVSWVLFVLMILGICLVFYFACGEINGELPA